MGRRPLDSKHLEIMIDYAMQCGDEGFTRAEAIREGVMTENRWALLRDKALREGLLRKEGWKKSARYFFDGEAYQIQQEKEEQVEEKDFEDEEELDLEELEEDEEFPWHELNEPEEEEHLGEIDDDLPFVIEMPFEDIPDDDEDNDEDVGVDVGDDDDLAAIINALGEDEQAPPSEPEKQPDLDWDFTF